MYMLCGFLRVIHSHSHSIYDQDFHEEEMERMNKPIKSCMTDAERYIMHLPDRSGMLEKELGYDIHNRHHRDWTRDFSLDLDDIIKSIFDIHDPEFMEKEHITILGNAESVRRIREDIRTYFIKDPNRIFPNEQELTAFMQTGNHDFQIQYCKIFETGFTKMDHNPKFTIIIHFSRPKGYWMEFIVPERYRSGISVSKCISSPVWLEY